MSPASRQYDTNSYEESPQLLGVINGVSNDSVFVHICNHGFSAMAFPPFNRQLSLGDFVMVTVRRNPDAQPQHRSKHRVLSLVKVRCPRCVKRIGTEGRHLTLKVAVRPVENGPDALILRDDVLGYVIDNKRKVPFDCLRNPDRLVVVTVRVAISPKKPDSSIFSVDQFVEYEEPDFEQRASSSTTLNHKGCLWDFRNDIFYVWSADFDRELELNSNHFDGGPNPKRGSWIKFGVPRQIDSKLEIQNFEFIEDSLPTIRTANHFEVKIRCNALSRRNRNGASLFESVEFPEVVDSQGIVPGSQLNLFPMELWLTPCINSGTWEISKENRDLFNRASPALNRAEKIGVIVYEDKAGNHSYVWCLHHREDLILRRETMKNETNLVGKWIRFRDATMTNGRYVIIGDVAFIPPVVPTRVTARGPELNISCVSFMGENDGYPVFNSQDVGPVADLNFVVKEPRNVALPFAVWVNNDLNRDHKCRWKISSQISPILSPTPSTSRMSPQISAAQQNSREDFGPGYPKHVGNFTEEEIEKTGMIVHEDKSGNHCYVWSIHYGEDLILRKDTVKNETNLVGKWVRFRHVSNSTGRFVIVGEAEFIPPVVPTRIKYNVPELNIQCSSLMGEQAGYPVFYSDDVGDVVDINLIVKEPYAIPLPFTVWVVKQKSHEHKCRWKISSQNTPVVSPATSSSQITEPVNVVSHEQFASKYLDDGGKYTDDEDDEDSPSSTVSSCVAEMQQLNVKISPVSKAAEAPDGKYDGKSPLELLFCLLDSKKISDFIRGEDEDLHAALVNSIMSSDDGPPH